MEFARAVRRSKFLKCLLSVLLLIGIYIFYKYGNNTEISGLHRSKLQPTPDYLPKNEKQAEDKSKLLSLSKSDAKTKMDNEPDTGQESINVMVTFTKAERNHNLISNFRTAVSSLFKFASVHVNFYLLGDSASEEVARDILEKVADERLYTMRHLNIDELVKQVHDTISEMQSFFSYKPGAYYSDSLFFLSIVAHKVLPDMHRVIMLDCDLKFNADVKELYNLFEDFKETNVMGIAHDAQPVYRHNWHMYRNKNKGTRVGDPPPDGLAGFNSGVLLLDLDKMRQSDIYNSLIKADVVHELSEKYMFKGNLGDQDFYSLIALEHEDLFYVLPCTWNRQLCTWWRDHGYSDVFDLYFDCDGPINIYHGNCNSPIPKLDWET